MHIDILNRDYRVKARDVILIASGEGRVYDFHLAELDMQVRLMVIHEVCVLD